MANPPSRRSSFTRPTPPPEPPAPPEASAWVAPPEPTLPRAEVAPPPTLAGVGTGDFRVSFTLVTKATVPSTIVHQRSRPDTTGTFWGCRMRANGVLVCETGQPYVNVAGLACPVNDGKSHAVVLERKSGTLSISVDGMVAGSGAAPADLGDLPPLATTGDPCEGVDGTCPLDGMITDLKVSR